jgi:hypothetical protein
MRKYALLVTLYILTSTAPMTVYGLPAGPSPSDLIALLSDGNYTELDRRLTSVQHAYEAGEIDDVALREVFRGLYVSSPDLKHVFDKWVEALPKSYAAHVARGIYYKKVGQAARGEELASKTSAQQFRDMQEALAVSSSELDKSMPLTRKPL